MGRPCFYGSDVYDFQQSLLRIPPSRGAIARESHSELNLLVRTSFALGSRECCCPASNKQYQKHLGERSGEPESPDVFRKSPDAFTDDAPDLTAASLGT